MKRILVFILLSLLVIACKKKSIVHITARNAVTGKPYPGLKYAIVRSKTGVFESHYKTVASGTLNENGEAVITKRFSKNWSHEVSIERPDNTCYYNENHFYFSGGDNINCDFKFAECGYRTLKINNVNCQGPNDLFDMNMQLLYDKNYTAFWFSEKQGCYSNEFSNEKVPAGKWLVEWWVTRSGNTNYFTDTIEIIENELFTYEINY